MILQGWAGADLGFSRGGADFQKIFQNFDDLFFLGRPNCFSELSQSTVLPLYWAGFWKKTLTKKSLFFGARSPSKLVYIGAQSALRKVLGSVGQKWISEKLTEGGPFGSAGGRIPEGGTRRPPPPPPLNPPLRLSMMAKICLPRFNLVIIGQCERKKYL